MRIKLSMLVALLLLPAASALATFSIVAIDPRTGDLGVAVASRYFAVGSVVPWAEAGVGAIATQADVNVGYGPRGLELLRQGLTAQQVLDRLLSEDTFGSTEGIFTEQTIENLLRRQPLPQQLQTARSITHVNVSLRGDRANARLRPRYDGTHGKIT